MKLVIIGLLFGLLFFGCTAPEAQPPSEETNMENQVSDVAEETDMENQTPVVEEPEATDENVVEEHNVDVGEGTVIDVGESVPVTGDSKSMISESELSAHAMPESCWVLYRGQVFDVTGFLNKHPGGAIMIEPHCGKTDSSFTDAFEGKHGLSKVEILESESILVGNYEG